MCGIRGAIGNAHGQCGQRYCQHPTHSRHSFREDIGPSNVYFVLRCLWPIIAGLVKNAASNILCRISPLNAT